MAAIAIPSAHTARNVFIVVLLRRHTCAGVIPSGLIRTTRQRRGKRSDFEPWIRCAPIERGPWDVDRATATIRADVARARYLTLEMASVRRILLSLSGVAAMVLGPSEALAHPP